MLAPPNPSFETQLIALRPALLAFAIKLTHNADRAEDLVQDATLRALERRELFQEGTNLSAWVFTILKHRWYSDLRRGARMTDDPDDKLALALPIEACQQDRIELKEALVFMDQMPAEHRRIVTLLVDGATYEEIAKELVLPVGTIKSRAHRARELLQAALS